MPDQIAIARVCITNMLFAIEQAEAMLGRLDAVAGDGDHGAGMVRGFKAAQSASLAADTTSAGQLVATAGSAFTDAAGGASGVLFGMFITTFGQNLPEQPDALALYQAAEAGLAIVCKLGKAQAGDKTMVDTLAPFVDALGTAAEAGDSPAQAWLNALPAAKAGMEATAEMISRRGRSSRLGDRSLGSMDPGAVSAYILLEAVGDTLRNCEGG